MAEVVGTYWKQDVWRFPEELNKMLILINDMLIGKIITTRPDKFIFSFWFQFVFWTVRQYTNEWPFPWLLENRYRAIFLCGECSLIPASAPTLKARKLPASVYTRTWLTWRRGAVWEIAVPWIQTTSCETWNSTSLRNSQDTKPATDRNLSWPDWLIWLLLLQCQIHQSSMIEFDTNTKCDRKERF